MRGSPPGCWSSPRLATAAPIRFGFTICGRTGSAWTTSGWRWRKTTSRTSSPGSTTWQRRRAGRAPSSPSWCPRRRLWRRGMTCPSTSTRRPSMSRWNTRPPARSSPSCGSWRRRSSGGWRNWRGWCDGEAGGCLRNCFRNNAQK